MRSLRRLFRSITALFPFLVLAPSTGLAAYEEYHCADDMVAEVVARAHDEAAPRAPNILMLSGGGSYGAWGAGFIEGWWQNSGKDVELDLITGVSAGSIVSVYVYLQAMAELRAKFLSIDTSDFYKKRFFLTIPFSSSVYATKRPQKKKLMPKLFPNEVIARVAERSADPNAPLLCIGSTRLSTGEFVKWDLVKVARAAQYDLFRTIVRSAIAFPILFEPVDIGGELHADGGVRHDIFVNLSHISMLHVITLEQTIDAHNILDGVNPDLLEGFSVESIEAFEKLDDAEQSRQLKNGARILETIDHEPNAYIVINGKTAIEEVTVEPKLLPLTGRVSGIMLKQSLYGSLYEIHYDLVTNDLHNHWDYFYTRVPESFDKNCKFIEFKPACTRKLYEKAHTAGSADDPWFDEFPAY